MAAVEPEHFSLLAGEEHLALYQFNSRTFIFFLLIPRRPKSTLFPYTTLFRSRRHGARPGAPRSSFRRGVPARAPPPPRPDRKSTRLNSSHMSISYAVFCLK